MRRSSTGQIIGGGSARRVNDGKAPLTRPFRDLVLARMNADPTFRDGLRREALDCIRAGDIVTGRSMLREYFDEEVPDLAALESFASPG